MDFTHDFEDRTESFQLIPLGGQIHRYRIEDVLGSGAMGIIYRAHDSGLNRAVALKFLAWHLCRDEECRKLFEREARAVAQLNHPNVITIYEVNEFQQKPYFAMELIDGGSLRNYVAGHRLNVEEILDLAIQICDGLAEAHAHQIVHRDIKPSNVLVNRRGRAKIVDFGLAAMRGGELGTDLNTIQGTARYMSPEQVKGLTIDERSDLFSLGVLLYEILAGRPPFTGENIGETFKEILETVPLPLSEYYSSVPVELQRIVSKLLKKNREERYQHADDVRVDLRYTLDAVLSGRARYPGAMDRQTRSIAVLPFKNMSSEPEQDYFCEGIAEEIINALTRVKGLRVAARTSTMPFKNSDEDARDIGRKLHVDTLLEGSARRAGSQLRVHVQLIDVATGFHLWSERYDRELEDVFAIQDEIAGNVVRAMQIMLSTTEQQAMVRHTTSETEAYDYYLRGRRFYHQGRKKSVFFALQLFQRAVELDDNFALAHIGIADCCNLLIHWYGHQAEVTLDQADRASRRAIELDPGLPHAHTARGFTLWLQNRLDEARVEFDTARQMDPGQVEAAYIYGRACFQNGEHERAAALFEEACRNREHHEARYFLGQTLTALGRHDEAAAAYRMAVRAIEGHVALNPDDARSYTMGAVALCRLGDRTSGLQWAEQALEIDPADPGIQYNVACLFALEGEHDRALDCLEGAVAAGFANRNWIEKDPDLDSLRSDPRFVALKWRE